MIDTMQYNTTQKYDKFPSAKGIIPNKIKFAP